MTEDQDRSTARKLALFRRCFTGLSQVYGTYDPDSGQVYQKKEPVTDDVLLAHLTGRQPYGVYLLRHDRTSALAVDFDRDDISQPVAFVGAAWSYGLTAYIERSKSKGYHVWLFFSEAGVSARKARRVAGRILNDIHCQGIEVFPKQDELTAQNRYGNFINAPLFGPLVAQGRTVFLDLDACATPFPDQWQFLEDLQRISEDQLDIMLAAHPPHKAEPAHQEDQPQTSGSGDPETSRFGLPPCARRMLAEGVTENQRVACFRLAVHLKRTGLPCDLAAATLSAWSTKNRPSNGKQIITAAEIIAQTRAAYAKSYRGRGCEEPAMAAFCRSDCPIYRKRHERKARSQP